MTYLHGMKPEEEKHINVFVPGIPDNYTFDECSYTV